jgi:hypothetical protein
MAGSGRCGVLGWPGSRQAGRVVASGPVDTVAEGIAIRVPVRESVERLRDLVDDMVLVKGTDLFAAMRLVADTLGGGTHPWPLLAFRDSTCLVQLESYVAFRIA